MNLKSMTAHDFVNRCVAYDPDAQGHEYACKDQSEQNLPVPKLSACCQCSNCQNGHKDTSSSERCDNARILQWLNNGYESVNTDSYHKE